MQLAVQQDVQHDVQLVQPAVHLAVKPALQLAVLRASGLGQFLDSAAPQSDSRSIRDVAKVEDGSLISRRRRVVSLWPKSMSALTLQMVAALFRQTSHLVTCLDPSANIRRSEVPLQPIILYINECY